MWKRGSTTYAISLPGYEFECQEAEIVWELRVGLDGRASSTGDDLQAFSRTGTDFGLYISTSIGSIPACSVIQIYAYPSFDYVGSCSFKIIKQRGE